MVVFRTSIEKGNVRLPSDVKFRDILLRFAMMVSNFVPYVRMSYLVYRYFHCSVRTSHYVRLNDERCMYTYNNSVPRIYGGFNNQYRNTIA